MILKEKKIVANTNKYIAVKNCVNVFYNFIIKCMDVIITKLMHPHSTIHV